MENHSVDLTDELQAEREAEAFVDAQWKAADEWLAAEWTYATKGERAVARSVWTELARRHEEAAATERNQADRGCVVTNPEAAAAKLNESDSGVARMEAIALAMALLAWKNASTNEWAEEAAKLRATLENASRSLAGLAKPPARAALKEQP